MMFVNADNFEPLIPIGKACQPFFIITFRFLATFCCQPNGIKKEVHLRMRPEFFSVAAGKDVSPSPHTGGRGGRTQSLNGSSQRREEPLRSFICSHECLGKRDLSGKHPPTDIAERCAVSQSKLRWVGAMASQEMVVAPSFFLFFFFLSPHCRAIH